VFDFDDPWWLIAVVLLVACWIGGILVPVRMASAPLGIAKQYVDVADDTAQQTPPPPPRQSPALPIAVLAASLGLVALSLTKRIYEPEGGNRWLWMCAAAGLAALWAVVLVMLVVRMAARGG
jgi:hypothetical protein